MVLLGAIICGRTDNEEKVVEFRLVPVALNSKNRLLVVLLGGL